ncbi:hypothetical protein L226DRAFT_617350 [Lentinus tigrinus ALCF2SS1-7]|uniref:DUF6699 domain-containing protein n=1 Tax=Lentinus tigrinus ALCF2SS1-6 TaxID=1328759 RepID=A0A5C2RUD3_9APHY|nr:hypothetical protein L227DRAFT_616707 [Lentinus tigrinus ALCF2SS1-6]RPD68706.1 hypothetical protein L226DRAFT_617350 [Lentinus tigrinus ALCF2SS1-7]
MATRKRVRFADTVLPTPPPSSASASFAGASASVSGQDIPLPPDHAQFTPRTPGPMTTPWLRTVPLPSHLYVPALSNAQPEHHTHPPPIRWDVGEHPNNITLGSVGSLPARDLTLHDLASCAVRHSTGTNNDPVTLRRITLVFPGLPLTVEIEPAGAPLWTSTTLPYIAVGDVLYGLYRALRRSVPSSEFARLDPAHRESVSGAFRRRLRSDRENYDKNLRHGVRNVDYLGHMRRFVGLRPAVGMEVPTGKRRGEVFVVVLVHAD